MSAEYLLSGEFHYFRTSRPVWAPALRLAREAGLDTVSIYVPWNWHQQDPEPPDFTGKSSAEHDLPGALDAIHDAGLRCILRPGPFITAEWRNGGIPDWLLTTHPEIRALDHQGRPAGHAYPAITYAHPAYRDACRRWLDDVAAVARGYLASAGGPIVGVQIDDEPSYWQQLHQPLAVDYNATLVDHTWGEPSAYAKWLLGRYGELDRIAAAHRAPYRAATDLAPPRHRPSELAELRRYLDWLDFKLDQINTYVAFLVEVAGQAGLNAPLSMLHPYLLPLNATKFAHFAAERHLDVQLTNECYLSLFSSAVASEQKIGSVLACHETYRLWQGGTAPVTMELQSSNASYLTAGAMELLYALTVARGIKGINYFMLVGGHNPPGFENLTGSEYDISAPISANARTRPHFPTISKLSRVVRAAEKEILAAEPARDVWIGCYVPYESAVLSAAAQLLDLDIITETFSTGDIGQSNAPSLPSLLALAGLSFGCLDIERADPRALRSIPQLWVPGMAFMSQQSQQVLVDYVTDGGHLVMLPDLPFTDDCGNPATCLRDFIWGKGGPAPEGPLRAGAGEPGDGPARHIIVRTLAGETLVAPGAAAAYPSLPDDATVVAREAQTGAPCAFTCARGNGHVTHLGFRLQYMPTTGAGQRRFVRSLAETATTITVTPSAPPITAFSLRGPFGGLLCVANPVELPIRGHVELRDSPEAATRRIPAVLEALEFAGAGARLLPVDIGLGEGRRLRHATWELIEREEDAGSLRLRFAATSPEGELAFEAMPPGMLIVGGELLARSEVAGASVLIVRAESSEVQIEFCLATDEAA